MRILLIKHAVLLLLLVNPWFVGAQNNRVAIDKSIAEYCECIAKAKDQANINSCQIEIDTISNTLSEYDKFYILIKRIRACGEAEDRFRDSTSKAVDFTELENFFIKACTYLTEKELTKFNLKRKLTSLFEAMQMIETYEPLSRNFEAQTVLEFKQSRQIVSNLDSLVETERRLDVRPWKQVPDSTLKAPDVFDFFSVQLSEETSGFRYSLAAGKGKLLCKMIILLSHNEITIVKELLTIMERKIISCDF